VWWPATAEGKLRFFQKEWSRSAGAKSFGSFLSGVSVLANRKGDPAGSVRASRVGIRVKVVVTNKTGIALEDSALP